MWQLPALLFLFAPAGPQNPQAVPAPILSRISEEAEVFQQNIVKALSQETLVQRSVLPPPRFKPRIGQAATAVPKVRIREREIVSEYSVGPLRESESHTLVEFRQVVAVDGKPVQSVESARHALSLGMRSGDERIRKRMLEDFARYGLVDIATDYGLILLAFTHRGLENIQTEAAGDDHVGADTAAVFAWRQTTPAGGQLQFHGRETLHQALAGKIWVRASDGLPLRIQTWTDHTDSNKHRIRDDATIDYAPSSHGFLTPASVRHRHTVDDQLLTENLYRYEPFKLFTSDAEIKFTELPDPTPPPPVKKK